MMAGHQGVSLSFCQLITAVIKCLWRLISLPQGTVCLLQTVGSVSEYSLKGLTRAANNSFAIAQRSWCEEVGKSMQEADFT